MTHNFDFKTIWDAFFIAVSPGVKGEAFFSEWSSLDEGHRVKIIMGEGKKPLKFTKREDFEQWAKEITSKI